MSIRRFSTTALAVVLSLTFATAPVMANPGNGNGGGHGNGGGQGNGGNHGNGNSGNSGNHGNKQNSGQDNPGKSDKNFKNSKDVGNDVDARVSFDHVRHLAVNYGLTGYKSLPPGIAKNLARTLYTILCKCLFSEVTVQAVTELDNKAAHCHTPVPQRHRPFL